MILQRLRVVRRVLLAGFFHEFDKSVDNYQGGGFPVFDTTLCVRIFH